METSVLSDLDISLPLALSLIAMGASVITAMTSVGALNRATKGNEAQVFLSLSQRYLTDEIRDSLRVLDEFYLKNREQYADMGEAWKELIKKDPKEGDRVKYAARAVCLFFVNLGRMYEAKLISVRLARALLRTPGTNTFYDVACPIQVAWIPDSVAPHYKRVCQRVVRKFGRGLDHRSPN